MMLAASAVVLSLGLFVSACFQSAQAAQIAERPDPAQAHAADAGSSAAMGDFESVLSTDPANVAARRGEVKAAIAQALLQRSAGKMDAALATLVRAKQYFPNDPTILMDFGIQADSMGIFRDADAALRKAHQVAPSDAKILYALAHVEVDEQKMPQAEADLRAYLRMRPSDASARYGLGHLLHMMMRDDAAKRELKRSLALQPHQTESWYELGEIALDRHQNVEATKDFETVLQRDPVHGGALTGMGILAFHAKDYASAARYLSQAVVQAPDYPAAHRFYAMVLTRMGNKQQAEQEEERARTLTENQNQLQHGYTLLQQQQNP
ncbi:MAG TPA: tetratricopeptide repeat protein [Acidobacteriaceae bacterium]|nr:tetratricopeptide repeat protein [Acidobacteriaceae bacterium]